MFTPPADHPAAATNFHCAGKVLFLQKHREWYSNTCGCWRFASRRLATPFTSNYWRPFCSAQSLKPVAVGNESLWSDDLQRRFFHRNWQRWRVNSGASWLASPQPMGGQWTTHCANRPCVLHNAHRGRGLSPQCSLLLKHWGSRTGGGGVGQGWRKETIWWECVWWLMQIYFLFFFFLSKTVDKLA